MLAKGPQGHQPTRLQLGIAAVVAPKCYECARPPGVAGAERWLATRTLSAQPIRVAQRPVVDFTTQSWGTCPLL